MCERPNFCIRSCERKSTERVHSNGWRALVVSPSGEQYRGHWSNSREDSYGEKICKNGLTYNGGWKNGKRDGWGTLMRPNRNGTYERIYIGGWKENMRWGEGMAYMKQGTYYGWWNKNQRDGMGVMWYNDKRLYFGEWQADRFHGVGVMFYVNGNRYEGHFARGYKNGEGIFYHMHTGQIQKGMWENDVCKTSLMQDEFRNSVDQPTEYPIPPCKLDNPDEFVRHIFKKYKANSDLPPRGLNAEQCLSIVRQFRDWAKLSPHGELRTFMQLEDWGINCKCSKFEKPIRLDIL